MAKTLLIFWWSFLFRFEQVFWLLKCSIKFCNQMTQFEALRPTLSLLFEPWLNIPGCILHYSDGAVLRCSRFSLHPEVAWYFVDWYRYIKFWSAFVSFVSLHTTRKYWNCLFNSGVLTRCQQLWMMSNVYDLQLCRVSDKITREWTANFIFIPFSISVASCGFWFGWR